MSWLSVIKNNIVNAITHVVPMGEQAPVHAKTSAVADAIGALLLELETVAVDVIDTAIATKFGAAADIVAHDFLNAIIAVATAKKTAGAKPAPTPVQPPSV
jgi:hypothetical protein